MAGKFKVGDLVKFNHHELATVTGNKAKRHGYKDWLYMPEPKSLVLVGRRRARRIAKIVYDPKSEHNLYYLGTNHRGKADALSTIGFYADQLRLVTEPSKRGRPRQKRKYTKRQNIDNRNFNSIEGIVNFAVETTFINKRLESIIKEANNG